MLQTIKNQIVKHLDEKEEISPFLVVWLNTELLHEKLEIFIQSLFQEYSVDKNSIFKIQDAWWTIKIEEVKKLTSQANKKSGYLFQVFIIENISRLTLKAWNALLKFLEEPWNWNIIFLTNMWENNIIDTILSRVQVVQITQEKKRNIDEEYYSLIDYFAKWSPKPLTAYIFKQKLEKDDYIRFLETLLTYGNQNFVFLEFLNIIEDSINMILHNNVLPKYLVDKIILSISEIIYQKK